MLSKEILNKIKSGEIKSRAQLSREVGVSRKNKAFLKYLDANNILLPAERARTKEKVVTKLKALEKSLGRLPKSSDDWGVTCAAQKLFGSWNSALCVVFGEYNQYRYSHESTEQLLDEIRQYVIKFQRLPLRSEFNGVGYPEWSTIAQRLGVSKWSEVLAKVDLSGITYFARKHGFGKLRVYKGVYYLSHEEYLIGKFLTDKGITFEKEVPYGQSSHRFDFYVPSLDLYIEYYGIATEEYMERIEEKRSLYKGRTVLEIFKHDNTVNKLALEVQRLQSLLAA